VTPQCDSVAQCFERKRMRSYPWVPRKIGDFANSKDKVVKRNILEVRLFLISDHHMSPDQVYVLDLSLVEIAFWAESPDRVDYMGGFYAS